MIFASRPATLETRSRARSPRAIAVSSAARTWQFEFVSDSRRIPSLSSPSEPRSTASSWLVPQHRALSEKITPQPAKNRPRVKKGRKKDQRAKKKQNEGRAGFHSSRTLPSIFRGPPRRFRHIGALKLPVVAIAVPTRIVIKPHIAPTRSAPFHTLRSRG